MHMEPNKQTPPTLTPADVEKIVAEQIAASGTTATQPLREPKKGDSINVVLADGTLAAGKIVKLQGNLADVEFQHRGATVLITGSRQDAECRKPDSWNFAD
jgi:hypothetical protein